VAFRLVNALALADVEAVRADLDDQGFAIIDFDGSEVRDKASFLARADVDLPRPDDLHPHNWDAFADTLWNGLRDAADDQLAIVWTHAERFVEADLGEFLMAVDVITTAARSVDKPTLLVLLGEGPGYAEFVPD
jgi:hypothetical protein